MADGYLVGWRLYKVHGLFLGGIGWARACHGFLKFGGEKTELYLYEVENPLGSLKWEGRGKAGGRAGKPQP